MPGKLRFCVAAKQGVASCAVGKLVTSAFVAGLTWHVAGVASEQKCGAVMPRSPNPPSALSMPDGNDAACFLRVVQLRNLLTTALLPKGDCADSRRSKTETREATLYRGHGSFRVRYQDWPVCGIAHCAACSRG
jgi:hypothetical protein